MSYSMPMPAAGGKTPVRRRYAVCHSTLRWLAIAAACVFFSALLGCTAAHAPPDASMVAPPAVEQLKDKYRSPETRATEATAAVPRARGVRQRAGNYILGPGDVLTIAIQRIPDASYDVAVRPDGYISLPVVGEVEAAGLTPAQLDDRLTDLFSERFVDPEVAVVVRSLRQPMVYVLGEVSRPGPILFSEATSAAEAIARAGDMLATGDKNAVTIIRLGEDGKIRPMVVDTSLGKEASQEPLSRDQVSPYIALAATRLEPEDILFVPESGIASLGTNAEQLFRPLNALSGGLAAVLNPWLLFELLEDLRETNSNVSVSAP